MSSTSNVTVKFEGNGTLSAFFIQHASVFTTPSNSDYSIVVAEGGAFTPGSTVGTGKVNIESMHRDFWRIGCHFKEQSADYVAIGSLGNPVSPDINVQVDNDGHDIVITINGDPDAITGAGTAEIKTSEEDWPNISLANATAVEIGEFLEFLQDELASLME